MARDVSFITRIKVSNDDDFLEAINGNPSNAMLPGDVVEFVDANTVQAHSTAAGTVLPLVVVMPNVATPDGEENNTSARVHYEVGDRVHLGVPEDGELWMLRMPAGATIAFGDVLMSDGDGHVVTGTVDGTTVAGAIIGVAAESKDNSGSTSPALVMTRIARA